MQSAKWDLRRKTNSKVETLIDMKVCMCTQNFLQKQEQSLTGKKKWHIYDNTLSLAYELKKKTIKQEQYIILIKSSFCNFLFILE